MATNNIDKNIKDKFANRTFKPSDSAWERLAIQLEEHPKKKKKSLFFYASIAASILLLISLGFHIFSDETQEIIPNDEVVKQPIKIENFDKKIQPVLLNVVDENVIVKKDGVKTEPLIDKEIQNIVLVDTRTQINVDKERISSKNAQINSTIAKVDEKIPNTVSESEVLRSEFIKRENLKQNPNNSIKINSDFLLYAVSHTDDEVKAYYAKQNFSRDDVLDSIKKTLKKTDFKVNPTIILAEVERSIMDDKFQNNFMNTLKRRVVDIASAIASRNE